MKSDTMVTVATWVPVGMAEELGRRASDGERSVSAEVRRALKVYLAVDGQPKKDGLAVDASHNRR